MQFNVLVQSRFTETPILTLTLTPNPNFGESGFGETGRHQCSTVYTMLL